MRFTRPSLLVLATGIALVGAACEQPTSPGAASPASTPSMSVAPQATAHGSVDQHAIGQAVPEFGGFFLEHGTPIVYLTDVSRRDAVAPRLAGFLQAHGLSTADLEVRKGRFGYRQLEGFLPRAEDVLFAHAGAVFADVDEAHDRVTLGAEASAVQGIRTAVDRLGFPDGAVEVVAAKPIVEVQTLQDRFDPVPGGVQIHFSNFLCSIGVIAQRAGQLGFVTASHCTDTQGGVEGTQYFQPLSSTDGTVIATEVADPTYFTSRDDSRCPRGGHCRFSDASFAASTGARSFALGEIAHTTGFGSLTFDGTFYDITGTATGNGVVGTSRSKVGRTTGFTTGTVTQSCVDTGVSGSNKVLLCQDFVSADGSQPIVGGGDSGSQVFTGTSNVTYWGQLWGGSSDNLMFVYSPASQVEQELGSLVVTAGGGTGGGGGGTTVSASFTQSCHFGDCTFDASGSTGAATFAWDFGDGGTGSGVTTSHTYTAAGTFTVTLTATASDGTTTDQATSALTCQTKGRNLQCK